MTSPAPTYDLVLLLDAQADEQARAKILADTRAAITADGEVVRDDDWGDRALAYPIGRKKDAEYHLLQFHTRTPALLHELDRTLRITDGVVRFRIVKLAPGTPDAPDMRSGAHARGHAPPATAAGPSADPSPSAVPPPSADPSLAADPSFAATTTSAASSATTSSLTPASSASSIASETPAPAASEAPGQTAGQPDTGQAAAGQAA